MSVSRPTRRPWNRMRLKAYAAAAPMNSAAKALTMAMINVFLNQVAYGHCVVVQQLVEVLRGELVGKMQLTASSPCLLGGHAAVSVLPPENARLMT